MTENEKIEREKEGGRVCWQKRFREILKIVNDKKTVTVQELTALLQTSESTIRRDLTTLHQRGVDQGAWRRYDCRV